jgi:hypothetical protein
MVSIPGIAGALAAIKTIKDLTQSVVTARDTAIIKEDRSKLLALVYDIQENLFAAQEERAALIKKIEDLEKKVLSMENWVEEKQRYKLEKLPNSGVFAYAEKPGTETGQTPHWICATCYENGKKSILQPETRNPGRALVLVCNTCGSEIYEAGARFPDHPKISPRRTRAV